MGLLGRGVDGNDQGVQTYCLQVLDETGSEQDAVGDQEGFQPQAPGLSQGVQKAGIEQGFPAGVTDDDALENAEP